MAKFSSQFFAQPSQSITSFSVFTWYTSSTKSLWVVCCQIEFVVVCFFCLDTTLYKLHNVLCGFLCLFLSYFSLSLFSGQAFCSSSFSEWLVSKPRDAAGSCRSGTDLTTDWRSGRKVKVVSSVVQRLCQPKNFRGRRDGGPLFRMHLSLSFS